MVQESFKINCASGLGQDLDYYDKLVSKVMGFSSAVKVSKYLISDNISCKKVIYLKEMYFIPSIIQTY